MIGEALIDMFFGIFRTTFGAFEFFKLPTELVATLTKILCYGNWVVGVDIMLLFVGSVVFWWTFQMSIGLIVWVWNKLPLT